MESQKYLQGGPWPEGKTGAVEIGRIPGEEVADGEGPVGERHEGGECYTLGCLARAGLAGGEPSAEQELRRRRRRRSGGSGWVRAG